MAFAERGPAGEHVIDNEYVPGVQGGGEAAVRAECAPYVGGLLFEAEAGLAAGTAAAAQETRGHGGREREPGGNAPGHHLGLVISPPETAAAVQGHGDDKVHVGIEWRGSQAPAQHLGEVAAFGQVGTVLQGLCDIVVGRIRPVEKQGGGIGVWLVHSGLRASAGFRTHGKPLLQPELYPSVQALGHGIGLPQPEIGLGQGGAAIEAYMLFLRRENAAADHAASGQQQVQQGGGGVSQPV